MKSMQLQSQDEIRADDVLEWMKSPSAGHAQRCRAPLRVLLAGLQVRKARQEDEKRKARQQGRGHQDKDGAQRGAGKFSKPSGGIRKKAPLKIKGRQQTSFKPSKSHGKRR